MPDIREIEDLKLVSAPSDSQRGRIRRIEVTRDMIAVFFENEPGKIFVFSNGPSKEILELHSVLELPCNGPGEVSFAWSPSNPLLGVVSSSGHAHVWTLSTQKKCESILLHRFHGSTDFQHVAFSKDGSMIVIVSGTEVLIVEQREGKWKQTKPSMEFSSSDYVSSIAIHPSNCAVALTSTIRKSVVIVGIPGVRMDTQNQLRVAPSAEEEECDHLNPNILQEIPTGPIQDRAHAISVCWSPYGEILAFASSDNYLTVWNVATRSIENFALDDFFVIRGISFLTDSHVVVGGSDGSKLVVVDIDDGVLFETASAGGGGSNTCMSISTENGPIVYRPKSASEIGRWELIF